jgi:hypothetical protein
MLILLLLSQLSKTLGRDEIVYPYLRRPFVALTWLLPKLTLNVKLCSWVHEVRTSLHPTFHLSHLTSRSYSSGISGAPFFTYLLHLITSAPLSNPTNLNPTSLIYLRCHRLCSFHCSLPSIGHAPNLNQVVLLRRSSFGTNFEVCDL